MAWCLEPSHLHCSFPFWPFIFDSLSVFCPPCPPIFPLSPLPKLCLGHWCGHLSDTGDSCQHWAAWPSKSFGLLVPVCQAGWNFLKGGQLPSKWGWRNLAPPLECSHTPSGTYCLWLPSMPWQRALVCSCNRGHTAYKAKHISYLAFTRKVYRPLT